MNTSPTNHHPETETQTAQEPENHPHAPSSLSEVARESAAEVKAAPQPTFPPFRFADLSAPLLQAVNNCGWQEAMPVQAQVIPWLMQGHDIIVQSQTGSGKTGAFLLPLLQRIDPQKAQAQALIMVPTRELAQQVKVECERLATPLGIRSVAVYGGVGYGLQLEAFRRGAHIIVGTPGRLLDHLRRRNLSLERLQYLILDEADEMLSMGFWPDMRAIRTFLPKQRVSAMFSATIPGGVRLMADEFLRNPQFIGLSTDTVHVADMDHIYYVVDPMQKDRVLMRILEVENPASAIIFCNTKSEVEYLAALLSRFGCDVGQISGDLSQKDREAVMDRLKRHQLRLLVATDVAARGIDVSKLEYVFVYDFPKDIEQYIHRAGRTGRAGNRGVAVSLVSMVEEGHVKRSGTHTGIPFIRKKTPTPEDVQMRLTERLMARLEGKLRDIDTAQRERMQGYLRLLEDLKGHEQGTEMMLMLLDETATRLSLEGRPTPEPLPAPTHIPRPSATDNSPYQPRRSGSRPPQARRRFS